MILKPHRTNSRVFSQVLIVMVAMPLVVSFSPAILIAQSTAKSKSTAWSQWRGPSRDGKIAADSNWPNSIDENSLQQSWQIKLGPSYSGPIVSETMVFTTETVNKSHEVVRAVDRKTGELKWETKWEGAMKVPFFARSNGDWIRSTPAFDGKFLYVGGIRDVLVCLNAESGDEVWRFDFVEQTGTGLPSFGFVCSPLIDGEFVYVQAGGGLCKLEKSTGKLVWRKLTDGGGMNGSAFSSPIITKIAGENQLLVQTRESLVGVNPESGEKLWSVKIPTFRGMNILTPTVYKNGIFTSAYGGSTKMIGLDKVENQFQPSTTWTNRATGYMSSPVMIGKHIYLHLRNQRFTCIDLETGESKWTSKPYGKYWSLVANEKQILALDERGDLLLINANPEAFEVVESRKVSDESAWAHLAISGQQIFVRGLNKLTCYTWKDSQSTRDNSKVEK